MEIHKKKAGPDYHRPKTMVTRSIEQDIRNNNFGARKRKLWKKRRGQEFRDKKAWQVTRTLKNGPRRMQNTEVDARCKVWFIQGETVEEVKPMDRLSRLTDAELTTQVRLGCWERLARGWQAEACLRRRWWWQFAHGEQACALRRNWQDQVRPQLVQLGRTQCDWGSNLGIQEGAVTIGG